MNFTSREMKGTAFQEFLDGDTDKDLTTDKSLEKELPVQRKVSRPLNMYIIDFINTLTFFEYIP